MSIAEKLTTIAENEPKVYNAGQISVLQNSKYMYPTVSGEIIRIDDMANVPHKVTVGKSSKNLFNINAIGDVVITAEGAVRRGVEIPFTDSITVSCGSVTSGAEVYVKTLIDGTYSALVSLNANRTYTFTGNGILIVYATSDRFFEYITNLQVELGATATAYTPYIEDLDAVKVYKYGKNLFTTIGRNKADLGASDSTTQRNITENSYYVGLLANNGYYPSIITSYDISDPTSIRINTGQAFNGIGFSFRAIPNATYTVSQSNTVNDKRVRLMFYAQDGTFISYSVGSYQSDTATAPENAYWLVVLLCPAVANTDVYFDNVMLEMSSTAAEYEPYTMEEVGATFDSTPNTTTLMPDTSGVVLDCQYCRDIDKYIDSLNVAVAMTGGA